MKRLLRPLPIVLLAACASGPKPPDWQANAKSALDAAVQSVLVGDSRAEAIAMDRARAELSRTGQPAVLARGELMRCAALVASLQFEPCVAFERLRGDAPAEELAYAGHLAARKLAPPQQALLPEAQRAAAAAVAQGQAAPVAGLQSVADPLSRLIAVAVLFEAGQASPDAIQLAVDTASAQGWRRPLLGWLKVQAQRATQAGDAAEAQRLQRRIALVEQQGR